MLKNFYSNFFDKEKYVPHYENLKHYLRLELEIKKTYCALEFSQSQCLKPYVEFNAHKRYKQKKMVTKIVKLCTNISVYGKTVENLRKRINVILVSNKRDYLKWTSKPNCMAHKIFGNDLVVIRKSKVTLTLNKPAYIGMRILELSKVLM